MEDQEYMVDPEIIARNVEVLRRKAAMAGANRAPGVQDAGRFLVAPSWTQNLNQLVGQARQGMLSNQADQAQVQGQLDLANQAQRWAQSVPQERQVPFQAPGIDEADAAAASQGAVSVVKPDQGTVLKHAMSGMRNPYTRDAAGLMLKETLVEAPKRAEAQRKQQLDVDTKLAISEEKIKGMLEANTARLADRNLDRDSRERIAAENRQLAMFLAMMRSQDKAADRDSRAGKVSDKQQQTIDEYRGNMVTLNDGITALESAIKSGDKGTKGNAAKNYAQGAVDQFLPGGSSLLTAQRSDELNNALGKIKIVSDQFRHKLYGSALTKTEQNSAAKYLIEEYDSMETRVRKAKELKNFIENSNHRLARIMRGEIEAGLPQNGVVMPKAGGAKELVFNPKTGKLE